MQYSQQIHPLFFKASIKIYCRTKIIKQVNTNIHLNYFITYGISFIEQLLLMRCNMISFITHKNIIPNKNSLEGKTKAPIPHIYGKDAK
jgi:hypothetical protein